MRKKVFKGAIDFCLILLLLLSTATPWAAATYAAGPASYSITAAAGTGGTISPSGITAVPEGGSQSYTITPNSGYLISSVVYSVSADTTVYSVSLDTVDVSTAFIYTFTNVTTDHAITASFTSENPGGGTAAYYNCTVDDGGDPIWDIIISSSGLEEGDSNRISAGSAVTVKVTRQVRGDKGDEALSASLKGLDVRSNTGAVTVTGSCTAKKGEYRFTMPGGPVTVRPIVDYSDLRVYVRDNKSGSYTLKETLSRDEMVSLAEDGAFYYTGYDRFPTAVIGKATQYIKLKDLFTECGITLKENSSILMTAPDGGTREFAYGTLYGERRYCYPNIDSASASGRNAIEPIIAIKGYQSRFIDLPSGKTIDDMAPDTIGAYRFAYGQTEAQFNGGTPSLDTATVYDFLKWTDTIKVTLGSEAQAVGGGGVAVVEAKAVIDAAGKASVTLEADTVKSSLEKAINAVKDSGAIPEVKIKVNLDETAKSVEVTLPGDLLKELAAPDKLLLTVSTPFGDVTLDAEAIKAIQAGNTGKDVKIGIAPVADAKAGIADGRELTDTVADVTLASGGKAVAGFGNGKLKIRIPFTPDGGQKVKGYYVVWLTDEGKSVRMEGSSYDSAAGSMQFETDHLSRYAVAYTSNTAVNIYSDIGENAWYADCVTFVTENGCFQGTSADTFSPDADMTRAMFVTVLGRAGGVKAENYTKSDFSDVAAGSWYSGYVQWAYENGIADGMGGGRFAPDQPVTREQMVAIINSYWKWKEKDDKSAPAGSPAFTDKDRISGWAAEGASFCSGKGWLTGYPDGSFQPQKTASRAEVAQIIDNIYNE
jgi:hypothetical protein